MSRLRGFSVADAATADDLDHLVDLLRSDHYVEVDDRRVSDAQGDVDYTVTREIEITPFWPDQAKFSFVQTREGAIGFEFENRRRLGARMGVDGDPSRVAGGFEPVFIDRTATAMLFNAAASGKICIFARTILGRIVWSEPAMEQSTIQALFAHGVPKGWVRGLEQQPLLSKKIDYHSWLRKRWTPS